MMIIIAGSNMIMMIVAGSNMIMIIIAGSNMMIIIIVGSNMIIMITIVVGIYMSNLQFESCLFVVTFHFEVDI